MEFWSKKGRITLKHYDPRQPFFSPLFLITDSYSNQDELIIIGSQAILGQFPHAPEELVRSIEADVFPKERSDLSTPIDGSLLRFRKS